MKNLKIYSVTVEGHEVLFAYKSNAKKESKEYQEVEIKETEFYKLLFSETLQDAKKYCIIEAKKLKEKKEKLNNFETKIMKFAEGSTQSKKEVAELPKEDKKEESKDFASILEELSLMKGRINQLEIEKAELKKQASSKMTRQELSEWYEEIDEATSNVNKFANSVNSLNEMIEEVSNKDVLFTESMQLRFISQSKRVNVFNDEIILMVLKEVKPKAEAKLNELKGRLENLKNK